MDPGVRYCTGCGHNNFDADAVAVDAQLKMQTRMEQLTASLEAVSKPDCRYFNGREFAFV
jgi:hypothetical protein